MGMATDVVNTVEMLLAQAQLLKAQAQLWLCHAHILEVQARHMRAHDVLHRHPMLERCWFGRFFGADDLLGR